MAKKIDYYKGRISSLANDTSKRKNKYTLNIRYFTGSPSVSLDSVENSVVYNTYNNFTDIGSLNVIRSCIDTLVSKMAQNKVRPYFNCVNGSFKDIQIVKQSQIFFDDYLDKQNFHSIIQDVFRDAAIFDRGFIFVENGEIKRAYPWQVSTNASDTAYNKELTEVYYERKEYPVNLLPEELKKVCKDQITTSYGIYWNSVDKIKVYGVPGKQIIEDYDKPVPFIEVNYGSPVNGNTNISLADIIRPIQDEIDSLYEKISKASELDPGLVMWVPEESNIKATALDNNVGNIYTYTATPNMTGSPVSISTPAFIDPSYTSLLNDLIQKAYEFAGISQLSASSMKPQGADSGIALQTLQNTESERFQVQLDKYIKSYTDVTKLIIALADPDEQIIPEMNGNLAITWGDVVEETKKMKLQYSCMDALSKDPSTKLQQLQMLAQAGVISPSRISEFLEIPDLQQGYSLANNAVNAAMIVIQRAIDLEDYDVPPYIPYMLLREEIINTQLSLTAAGYEQNMVALERCQKLYEAIDVIEEEAGIALEAENQAQISGQINPNVEYVGDMQMAQTAEAAGGNVNPVEAQAQDLVDPQMLGNT